MPILLYCVGAVAFAMGAAAIGYGIPINEFSFGNTLIISGTVLVVGGLVVLALGMVASRVQQLAEALARSGSIRLGRVEAEMQAPMRAAVQPGVARMPFPPKPKAPPQQQPEAAVAELEQGLPEAKLEAKPDMPPAPPPPTAPAARPFAMPPLPKRPLREPEDVAPALSPLLPNPEVGVEPDADEVADVFPAAPAPGTAAARDIEPPSDFPPFRLEPRDDDDALNASEPEGARTAEPAGPVKTEPGAFDAMWPASRKPETSDAKPRDATAAPSETENLDEDEASREEPRTVAILKSGVVDGMAYTLYVDGSIEAELPQGTLRFASINELRAHLEKTG